jgi:3-oxoacyl-[acyl-carrier protein] reductase
MDLGITGKVALVTGASKGIGFGIARALAAEGARVAVSSRDRERIEQAAARIGAVGLVHDTRDLDRAFTLVEQVREALGPVDILAVSTGGPPAHPDALGFSRAEWEAAYRELVLGTIALLDAALPGMRERGWGRVVNVSSSAAREPLPSLMLSNTHRAGLLAAFKTIARQVAGDGVTLNTILPGRVDTDRVVQVYGSREAAVEQAAAEVPARRMGTVEELGALAAFLCSVPAAYVTGTAVRVDGGLTYGY